MDSITGGNVDETETVELKLKRKPSSSPDPPLKKKCFKNKENLSPRGEENLSPRGEENLSPRGEESLSPRGEENLSPRGEDDPEIDGDMIEIDSTETDEKKDDEDEVTEITPPLKERAELIILDDKIDDTTPGPDEVPTSEERGFWKAVEENPNDFASWTYLLQVVEKNGKRKQIERAFSSFLGLYPYCYGYWKKYADQMKKLISPEACNEIFEKGVRAIPLSVDLWTYFIHFIAEWKQEDASEIRLIYQRAVEACGKEFRSDKIWEAYVEWEKQNDKMRVLGVYKQLLGTVVQRHQRHYDRFREWLFLTPVNDMLDEGDIIELYNRPVEGEEVMENGTEDTMVDIDEFSELDLKGETNEERSGEKEDTEENGENVVAVESPEPAEKITEEMTEEKEEEEKEEEEKEEEEKEEEEKEEETPEEDPKEEEEDPKEEKPLTAAELAETASETFALAAKIPPPELTLTPLPSELSEMTEEQMTRVRETLLAELAPIHEQTLAEIKEVLPFEEAIRRPYFHVKELERAQLKNWKNYLNLIMEKNNQDKIMILFERCLIACAFYEGFWLKYAHFLESVKPDLASVVYRKACTVHLSKKPQIHLSWAAFEELRGNMETAREALDHIDKNLPGLIAVTLRRVGLERRAGDKQSGADILKEAVNSATADDMKEFWTIKYVNYAQNVLQNLPLARQVIKDAIAKSKDSKKLHLRWVELEMSQNSQPDVAYVESSFDAALDSELSSQTKVGFSQRKMCFLEEYCNDIKKIMDSYEYHHRNFRKYCEQKRKSEDKVKLEEPTTTAYTTPSFTPYGAYGTNQGGQYGVQSAQYQQWYAQQYAQYGYTTPQNRY